MKEKLRFTVFLKKLFLVEKVIFEPRFSKLLFYLKTTINRDANGIEKQVAENSKRA